MKIISRATLRGKKLHDDCKKAKRTNHQWGKNDNRVFCYGFIDDSTECPLEECVECGAFVDNARPLSEVGT